MTLSFLLLERFFFTQSPHFADGKLVQKTELNPLGAKYQPRSNSACLLTYRPGLFIPPQLTGWKKLQVDILKGKKHLSFLHLNQKTNKQKKNPAPGEYKLKTYRHSGIRKNKSKQEFQEMISCLTTTPHIHFVLNKPSKENQRFF